MQEWQRIVVMAKHTLRETMKIIDESSLQFAVVVDQQNKLLGTVTDGDIRRAILRGIQLDAPIKPVMNSHPVTANHKMTRAQCQQLMKKNKLKQLPIVDEHLQLIDIIFEDNLKRQMNPNKVILMLGGLGQRLRPLTNDTPKPMLKVGNRPIVETILNSFKQHGYKNFVFAVNYKKEVIQQYFQSGEVFDISIDYIEEEQRMGTAGALSLLENRPTEPFFVMNGDLLTQVNFNQLLNYHLEHGAVATMCVRECEFQIPYGVVETDGVDLLAIKEKPVHRNFVNAGIYVLNPEVFDFIPKNTFYDMPTLFEQLVFAQKKTVVFPIHEYWLDIGQPEDFKQANKVFGELMDHR